MSLPAMHTSLRVIPSFPLQCLSPWQLAQVCGAGVCFDSSLPFLAAQEGP